MALKRKTQVWIGMIEVRPLPDCKLLETDAGAFVNVLTWAANEGQFRKKAEMLMEQLGLQIVGIENPEPLTNREAQGELDKDIADIAAKVRINPAAIMYSSFHTWPQKIM